MQVLEIPTLSCTDVEPDCSPDFDFPPRGSITKSEAADSADKKVILMIFSIFVRKNTVFLAILAFQCWSHWK